MNQNRPTDDGRSGAKSAKQRIATRDLVTIGQRWKRRHDQEVVMIRQVHRADRQVQVQCTASPQWLFRLSFRDLRANYELAQPNQGDQLDCNDS